MNDNPSENDTGPACQLDRVVRRDGAAADEECAWWKETQDNMVKMLEKIAAQLRDGTLRMSAFNCECPAPKAMQVARFSGPLVSVQIAWWIFKCRETASDGEDSRPMMDGKLADQPCLAG